MSQCVSWLLAVMLPWLVSSIHPECALILQIQEAEARCLEQISQQKSIASNSSSPTSSGCPVEWDEMECWPEAVVGDVVNRTCPSFLFPIFATKRGLISRNCTERGWSGYYPPYHVACQILEEIDQEPHQQMSYYIVFKHVNTAGYATSLIALVSSMIIFAACRKFRCTRNYIHMNLFVSFILRAAAVFIKNLVLFADERVNHCFISTVSCKLVITFFQYCILANFFWLLVEGLYLQTLLTLTFVSTKKYFWWYIVIGWGAPFVVLTVWIISKLKVDNVGCWDDNENEYIWWIIRGAILFAVLVNFMIFLNIIRILVEKLKSQDTGGNPSTAFSRLTKSTLLLIPLFGIHYILCVFLPDSTAEDLRLFVEIGIGSFQGFVVALLYCFLNGEVLTELKRHVKWCYSLHYPNFSNKRGRNPSAESNAINFVTQMSLLDKLSPKRKTNDNQHGVSCV